MRCRFSEANDATRNEYSTSQPPHGTRTMTSSEQLPCRSQVPPVFHAAKPASGGRSPLRLFSIGKPSFARYGIH